MCGSTATLAQQEWYTRAEAESYLRLKHNSLAQMAYRGTGPKFKKVSYRHTLYRRADLDAWIEEQDTQWQH